MTGSMSHNCQEEVYKLSLVVNIDLWEEKTMPDAYTIHVEKRIKELHERMFKSKLHTPKKRKY